MREPVTSDSGIETGHGVSTIGPAMRRPAASISSKVTDTRGEDLLKLAALSRLQQVQVFSRRLELVDCLAVIDFDGWEGVEVQTQNFTAANEICCFYRVGKV